MTTLPFRKIREVLLGLLIRIMAPLNRLGLYSALPHLAAIS